MVRGEGYWEEREWRGVRRLSEKKEEDGEGGRLLEKKKEGGIKFCRME